VTLDGDTAHVVMGEVLGFTGREPFSIEAWIRPATLDGPRAIVTRSLFNNVSGVHDGYRFEVLGNQIVLERSSQTKLDGVAADTPPLGVYSHVVGVYDGAFLSLYVNGSMASSAGSLTEIATMGSFAIGADLMHGTGPIGVFAGSIDEVAVYDHALTPQQITAHFRAAAATR
jgi:hypothetical protein